MTGDRLEDLLRRADQLAGEPPVRIVDLGGRVRQVRRRRRIIVRASALASAAVIIVVAGVLFSDLRSRTTSPPSQTSHDWPRLQASAEFKFITETLNVMDRESRLAEAERSLIASDPLDEVRQQMETAACTMVCEADALARRPAGRAMAAEKYQRVLVLYPDTSWASTAGKKLSEMKQNTKKQGDRS